MARLGGFVYNPQEPNLFSSSSLRKIAENIPKYQTAIFSRIRDLNSYGHLSTMDHMNKAMEKVKMLVGIEVEQEEELQNSGMSSFMDDFHRDCTLSATQRMYGFAICLVAGLACTLLSMLVFFNPIKFGVTFTFGNLLALGSTAFLIGPKRQVTMMLDPVRIYATAIYISSMIIALFCAFYVRNKLLTLLAIILEFGALVWYGLSYIPFARAMVSKVMLACFDTEF